MKPTEQATLIPCPWCKTTPEVKQGKNIVGHPRWRIECMNKECDFYITQYPDFTSEAEAIDVWNRTETGNACRDDR